MKNFLKRVVAIGIALGLMTAPLQAQVNVQGIQLLPFKATYVSQSVLAADADHALYIKYFGPGGTSTTTVAVEANGDLTFVVNGAAYAGFECPVSGALGGVIDTSNAACDTLGEVVDVINATATSFSTGYFRAVIAAGLRSETSDNNFLADAADTEVTTPVGEIVFWDSSNADDVHVGLWDKNLGVQVAIPSGVTKVPKNPYNDVDSVLEYLHENITNAGTITNTEVYCVVENYNDGKSTGSETATLIYLEAGAASAAVGKVDEFNYAGGGLHCQHGKIVARVLASGADTSAQTVFATGYLAPVSQ